MTDTDCPTRAVLIIDDDPDLRLLLIEILAAAGFDAHGAANGAEALQHLADTPHQPCVILLDLMMPVMDGWTFRREQRRHDTWRHVPVIVLSGVHDAAMAAQALAVAGYLAKPLDLDTLVDAVTRHCQPLTPGAADGGAA